VEGYRMTLFNMASKDEIELSSRAAAKAIYVGEHTAICRVLEHYKMYVDTRDQGIVPHLMMDGFWESWVTACVSKMVRPGMRIANVGASFGYYALLFADLVGGDGEVYAFEPCKEVFAMLGKSRVVNGFGHLMPFPVAIADQQGKRLLVHPKDYLNSHLVTPADDVQVACGELVTEQVTTTTLDLAVTGVLDLVLIDAEGAEPEIWRGMKQIRQGNPELITVVEFAPSRYKDPEAFATELAADGRHLFVITETGQLSPRTVKQVAAGEGKGLPGGGEEFMVVVQLP
jgi:FkbM family methyltransferase